MSNREGDIDQIIAKALKGEIERLPPEGGSIDLRIKVEGDWVGGDKTVNVNPIREVPEGNPNRRECPQCSAVTWLATEECRSCGYNLFTHDAKLRRERIGRRNMKFIIGFGVVAIAGGYLGRFAPVDIQLWVYGFSVISAMMAMGLMKD